MIIEKEPETYNKFKKRSIKLKMKMLVCKDSDATFHRD